MMKIFKENAEESLVVDLQGLLVHAPETRCLYLRLSGLSDMNERTLNSIVRVLKNAGLSGQSRLYICRDQDVLLLNENIGYDAVEKFYTHLTPDLLPAVSQDWAWLASLFEIGKDWETLRNIALRKLEAVSGVVETQATGMRYESHGYYKNGDEPRRAFLKNEHDTMDTLPIFGEFFRTITLSREASTIAQRRLERSEVQILITEDDPFSQNLVKIMLDNTYGIGAVNDGYGTILSYVACAPDVLFLDIGLPDMDGLAVLERIFALDPDAYVVMCSGHSDVYNVTKAMDLGAKGFLSKPFDKEKFMAFIEKSPHVRSKKQPMSSRFNGDHMMV